MSAERGFMGVSGSASLEHSLTSGQLSLLNTFQKPTKGSQDAPRTPCLPAVADNRTPQTDSPLSMQTY